MNDPSLYTFLPTTVPDDWPSHNPLAPVFERYTSALGAMTTPLIPLTFTYFVSVDTTYNFWASLSYWSLVVLPAMLATPFPSAWT